MRRSKLTQIELLIAKIERARKIRSHRLDLSGKGFRELPAEIGCLTQLESLDVGSNELVALPDSIGDLKNLVTLRARRNALESLPASIGHLVRLNSLNVSANKLTTLPESIGRLRNLQTLDVTANHLSLLPNSLGDLRSLKSLLLADNYLASVPDDLKRLESLHSLTLDFNTKLSALPSSLGRLTNLVVLSLFQVGLDGLPEWIRELPCLKRLYLGHPHFQELPEWIGDLRTLEELSVIGTSIERLPETIGELQSLTRLCLDENRLQSLPESLGRLRNLRTLEVHKNKLINLPCSLSGLTDLASLDLRDNPLSPGLRSAYRQGLESLRVYLRSLAQAEPLYEAKVMLVGEGGVGKTTLLRALSGREPRANEPTTHGVSIDIHSMNLPHPHIATEQIHFNAWDFGGQEVYRVTHQFFFSHRSIYLLVWEPRMGLLQCQVEDWLKLIRLRVGADARVIIVSTHCKTGQRIARIDRPVFLRDYGSMIAAFVEVDSLVDDASTGDKYGVSALKDLIAQAAANLEQMGMPFNSRWKNARDEALRIGATRPHVAYDVFAEICVRHQLDTADTRTLAGLMHDLGYIVHYGADERLKHDVVLQPEWLTKAIGFVLEDRVTQENEGILQDSHLQNIWQNHVFDGEPRYEPFLYPFFLRLMEKYDVSYRLAEGHASLVAQHVPQVRPNLPWLPEDGPGEDKRRLSMLCVMEESPPGLIPWMIVRTHDYAVERDGHRLHWEKGMFLRNKRHGEAMIELRGRELHLYTEALWPEYFMNVLQQTLTKLIVDNWPGLLGRYRFTVPCRERAANGEVCQGRFEIDALRQFLGEGDKTIRCQLCRRHQPILKLLFGFEYDEPRGQLSRIEKKLDQGFETIEAELGGLESRLANAVMILMRAMANEAKDGPRLFDLYHTGHGWRPLFNIEYRLRFWCEATNCEHPIIDDGKGIYSFQGTREWLVKLTPYATFVASILRTLIPIVAPAVNIFVGSDVIDQARIRDHIVLMKTLTEKISGELTTSQANLFKRGVLADGERSGLLALHALLRDLDPTHERLGLYRVPTYTGDYQWLCRAHYEMSQPKIPDRIAY